MPLYEYKCDRCEKVIEVIQKFSDDPLTIHEECGGNLEKLFSSPAFQFKGSGFYITDYAKGKSSAANGKSAKSESTASETSKSSSTESKPAAPAATSTDSKK